MEQLTGYRLSPQQQMVWLRGKQSSVSQLVIKVVGNLDINQLKEATQIAIQGDTILRTTYLYTDGLDFPLQTIHKTADFIFNEVHVSEALNEHKVIAQAATHHFNFANGPLLRLDVAHLDRGSSLLVITTPGLCADSWSLAMLGNSIMNKYLRVELEETPVLPYLQFSEWQNQLFESEDKQDGVAYWNTKHYPPQQVALLFDDDPRGTEEDVLDTFTFKVTDSHNLLTGDTDTRASFLGLCWQIVLWQFTGQQRFVSGHYNINRDFKELYNTLGLFAQSLPVSISLLPHDTFKKCLEAYHAVIEANDEFKVFYGVNQQKKEDSHNVNHYAFEYLDIPVSFKRDAASVQFEITHLHGILEGSKIHLCCIKKEDGIWCTMHFNKNAFSLQSIQYIARVYQHVMEQCADAPEMLIGDIALLSFKEACDLHEAFHTASQQPQQKHNTVTQLFAAQVEKNPDAIAVVADNVKLSYGELNAQVVQLAYHLKQEGIQAADHIALMCSDRAYLIIGMLGILKAGATYIPIDPSNPADRTAFILQDSVAKALITETQFQESHQQYKGKVVCLDVIVHNNQLDQLSLVERQPDTPAYIIYTSGTTGTPKGVVIPDSALVNYTCWLAETFSINQNDSTVLLSSYAFDLGYTSIWGALLHGGCLHLVNSNLNKEAEALVDFIVDQEISFLKATPSLFHIILQAQNVQKLALSKLRLCLMGGEPIRVKDLQHMVRIKSDIMLVNHYGPTETTIGTIAKKIDNERLSAYSVHPAIGKPITNSFITILDAHNDPVVPGVVGELCISGKGLAKGYLHRDALTREKFGPHPFKEGLRLYRTGDQAYWLPDGNIMFVGRKDDQVKIRGFRVELNEVQHALLQHHAIKDAVVIARDNEAYGKELVAYIELTDNQANTGALREALSKQIPEYMVPSFIVPLEKFPLTPNGKIDKKRLPYPESSVSKVVYVKPQTSTEVKMAVLWESVLEKEKIGIHEEFFELGGHSLKAIKLVSRIHKELDVKISLGDIFAHNTIHELSAWLENIKPSSFAGIPKIPEANYYELSHAQMRIWLVSQKAAGNVAYNVPIQCILEGALNKEALMQAFRLVIERHDSFRTIFPEIEGGARQVILSPVKLNFNITEIDCTATEDADRVVEKMALEERSTAFELNSEPAIRGKLIKVKPDEHVLFVTTHHIISDGWSRGILYNELFQSYNSLCVGNTPALAPLRIQYKDYALWQHNQFQAHHSYWQKELGGHVPKLNFPLDKKRPVVNKFEGKTLKLVLPEAVTTSLADAAKTSNSTLNNLIIAAYAVLLHEYTGQDQLVIGSIASGRNHIDLENLVGVFINYLPLRIHVTPDQSFASFLKNVDRDLLEAYQHQDYPYDLMVGEFYHAVEASRNPFFDTMMIFHNEQELFKIDFDQPLKLSNNLSVRPYMRENDKVSSKLDFKFDLELLANRISLTLEYNRNLFEEATMQAFLHKFEKLLQAIAESTTATIAALNLLEEAERRALALKRKNYGPQEKQWINVLASFTAEPMEPLLNWWMDELSLPYTYRFAPYNQVFQQLLQHDVASGEPAKLMIILNRLEDYVRGVEADDQKLMEVLDEVNESFIKSLRERSSKVTLLIGLFAPAAHSTLSGTVVKHIERLNAQCLKQLKPLPTLYWLDTDKIANRYAVAQVYDPYRDKLGHIPFTEMYFAALATSVTRMIAVKEQLSKCKVIVLDCDNTLWKGICGEKGALGVAIEPGHHAFQEFMLQKYKEGFLLAILSKNNEQDVWEVFQKNPDMVLKQEHFVAWRINWESKSENILALAQELNVGLDSFTFFDDSPVECQEMMMQCPEVLTLELPEHAAQYIRFLHHVWALDKIDTTEEDSVRSEMYKAENVRKKHREESPNLNQFLNSLELAVSITEARPEMYPRLVQLTLRTNQFNLNTIRRSEGEIEKLLRAGNTNGYAIHVKDKFGNYGLVGFVMATLAKDALLVDTFLLSCRVLGRGVEHAVLAGLKRMGQAHGLPIIKASFRPTEKNAPFKAFISATHWKEVGNTAGSITYQLPVEEVSPCPEHITCYYLEQFDDMDQAAKDIDSPVVKPLFNFDHTGIAVSDIAEGIRYFSVLGYTCTQPVFDPIQNVYLTMCHHKHQHQLELIAPFNAQSPVQKILETSGDRPYHICFRVPSFQEAQAYLDVWHIEYEVISQPSPAILFGGESVMFIFNRYIGLVEFIEDRNFQPSKKLAEADNPFLQMMTYDVQKAANVWMAFGYENTGFAWEDDVEIQRTFAHEGTGSIAITSPREKAMANKVNSPHHHVGPVKVYLSGMAPAACAPVPHYVCFADDRKEEQSLYTWDKTLANEEKLLHAVFYKVLKYSNPADLLQAANPTITERDIPVGHQLPSTEVELKVADIWKEVLQLNMIGVHEPFFSLGGHSLKAVQVLSRIYKSFHVEIPLHDFFEHQTIFSLAEKITLGRKNTFKSICPLSNQQYYAASHAQKRLWAFEHIEKDQVAYNMAIFCRIKGPLNKVALQQAFDALIDRHESLRTTFIMRGGELCQDIKPSNVTVSLLEEVDLCGAADAEIQAREIAGARASLVFDLANGPLVRATLIKTSSQKHVLSFTMHHIISDAWSLMLMADELTILYKGFSTGLNVTLPHLKIQYKDYAAWQNDLLQDDNPTFQQNKLFWNNQFAGDTAPLKLPADYGHSHQENSFSGKTIVFEVGPDVGQKLYQVSQAHNASLFMTLFAASSILLHRSTGENDFVVGTSVWGREHPDLEQVIGFFANILPVRLTIEEDEPFTTFLTGIREHLLKVYAHRSYPYDILVNEVTAKHRHIEKPLFNVLIELINNAAANTRLPEAEDLSLEFVYEEKDTSKFDVTLKFVEGSDKTIKVKLEYNAALYADETMETFKQNFLQILLQLTEAPETKISEIIFDLASEAIRTDNNNFDFDFNI